VKRCARCGEEKDEEEFHRSKVRRTQVYCKSCHADYMAAYRRRSGVEAFRALGQACECCGETQFLGIYGDGLHPVRGYGRVLRTLRDEAMYEAEVREARDQALDASYWIGRLERCRQDKGRWWLLCRNCATALARRGSRPHHPEGILKIPPSPPVQPSMVVKVG
jgi:hypothetical protein